MDKNPVEIGKRIRSIRDEKGMTSEEFANIFNPPASKGTVSKWENGKYLPNNKRLVTIAGRAGISVDKLLYGSPEEFVMSVISEESNKINRSIDKKSLQDTIELYSSSLSPYGKEDEIWSNYLAQTTGVTDILEYAKRKEELKEKIKNEFISGEIESDFYYYGIMLLEIIGNFHSQVADKINNYTEQRKRGELPHIELDNINLSEDDIETLIDFLGALKRDKLNK